jgi:hypothetical protein
MRKYFIFISLLFLFVLPLASQDKEMFKQKRERKRVWRKWRSDKEAYNPYLKKKAKDKPSARIAKGNRKEIRQQKRKEKRQMRKSKRQIKKHSKVR